jgi:hypothetical protein
LPKKFGENNADLAQITTMQAEKDCHDNGFKASRHFFAENLSKSPKIMITTLTSVCSK